MNHEAEKRGANGVLLLYRGYSIDDSVRWPQTSVDGSPQTEWAKRASCGMRLPYGIQHLVTPDGIESIFKIQFEDDLTGLEVVQKETSSMNGRFCSLWGVIAQLTWCKSVPMMRLPAVLEARRRLVHPTAIGLTPPSFFLSATRDASK